MFDSPLSTPVLWGLLLACGLGTWVLRASFIQTAGAWSVPDWLSRALRYVPPAVLAALVTPALLRADVLFTPAWSWPQPAAGLVAAAVAVASRRVVVTLVAGMVALWIFSALA
ncbi:AzlD domain-containing protein [Roseospira visakhapatnamensis]|nr:AzlD domain-containing protein [Roseospira visakhapatnamensis]